tara:strand:- start:54 stop:890 length:837 start_codon:yes stop_codon:yes gene_type:complete
MLIKSFSKINLTLKVISKSKGSLHKIQSLYCWIDLFDKIRITKIKKNQDEINFKGPFSKLIKKKDNSVINLLQKLRQLNLISGYYSITVLKNIPVFGGLGGGTSNAAFILKYLLKNKIKHNLIEKFEGFIGSDLKLFFTRQGFLKDLRTIIFLKRRQNFFFVLAQPKIKCSTREIYSKVKKFSKKEIFNKNILNSRNKFIDFLSKNRNDLQFIVERKYPILKRLLKDIKNEEGCCFSRMTGSGSVCYGLFNDKIDAKNALNKLKKKYPKIWFSFAKTV